MNRHEKAQGLVEYTLILVLVAIPVAGILSLLGQNIESVFCRIEFNLGGGSLRIPEQRERMGVQEKYLQIDVKPSVCIHEQVIDWTIHTNTTHGSLENNGDGTFTYQPYEVGSGIDDRFTYGITAEYGGRVTRHTGDVIIIVGRRDVKPRNAISLSAAADDRNLIESEQDEQVLAFFEAAKNQEESLYEIKDLSLEAVVEGVEVGLEISLFNDAATCIASTWVGTIGIVNTMGLSPRMI